MVAESAVADLKNLSERLLTTNVAASGTSGNTEDDRNARLLSIAIESSKRQGEIVGLKHDLDGLTKGDVLQQPSLPAKPLGRQTARQIPRHDRDCVCRADWVCVFSRCQPERQH